MLDKSFDLLKSLEDMQIRFHIKTTKTAERYSENLWEQIANECKDKKQDRGNRV